MAAITPLGLPVGVVTLLFSDIEGSTRLLHELGDAYGAVLGDHHRLLRGVWLASHIHTAASTPACRASRAARPAPLPPRPRGRERARIRRVQSLGAVRARSLRHAGKLTATRGDCRARQLGAPATRAHRGRVGAGVRLRPMPDSGRGGPSAPLRFAPHHAPRASQRRTRAASPTTGSGSCSAQGGRAQPAVGAIVRACAPAERWV